MTSSFDPYVEGFIWSVTYKLIRSRAVEPQFPQPKSDHQYYRLNTTMNKAYMGKTSPKIRIIEGPEIDPIDAILLK